MRTVDVAIIGAGSAGIAARSEVARVTDDYVVIDDGTLGTTCARVGCMPSKALIQVANDFQRRTVFEEMGIAGAGRLAADRGRALAHVRRLRDGFVAAVLKDMRTWEDHLVRARARFVDPDTLAVGQDTIKAKAIVVATGSRPIIPPPWRPTTPPFRKAIASSAHRGSPSRSRTPTSLLSAVAGRASSTRLWISSPVRPHLLAKDARSSCGRPTARSRSMRIARAGGCLAQK